MVFPTLAFLSAHSLGWPIAFTALGATMFALCTLRRARLHKRGVEALQQAYRAMLAALVDDARALEDLLAGEDPLELATPPGGGTAEVEVWPAGLILFGGLTWYF